MNEPISSTFRTAGLGTQARSRQSDRLPTLVLMRGDHHRQKLGSAKLRL